MKEPWFFIRKMVRITDKPKFRKPTKTLSGVTPLAVVVKPRACKHGVCLYCPSLNVPQSYTPKSPAIMRAIMFKYDAKKQIESRLKAFKMMKHPTDKIELIIMGGTFLDYPLSYQYDFVKECYDAFNGKKSRNIEDAKKINEKAKHRVVAFCIETRPDVCGKKEIKRMLDFGVTRVEIGVQAPDDVLYIKIKRGHGVLDVYKATQNLRDAGFKIGYHIMLGLPGSNIRKDIKLFKELFKNEKLKPDHLKIYPCQVIKGAELEELYKKGKYQVYSDKELIKLIIKLLKIVPEYCRVMRIMREIPPEYLIAGSKRTDLRKVIHEEIIRKKINLKEIRHREIGINLREGRKINKNLSLKTIKYKASEGKEFFVSIVNKQNILFALLRLRIDKKQNLARVRELHVYGKALEIGKKGSYQHKGFGKTLMQEAEKIAKKEKCRKISVISGIGVREYYRKLKYKLEGYYMVKYLN